VCPRARRIAVIVASVPEDTRRTSAIDGTSRQSVSAISTSAAVGAPKDSARAAAACTASTTCGCVWPATIGPHEPT